MTIEFTDSVKTQIILAAMQTAGPTANDGDVANHVSRAIDFLTDGSSILAAFDRAVKRQEAAISTTGLVGEILFVDTETSSNRPIVFIRTEPSEHAPDGVEHLRLDRLDSADADRVKSLANELLSLVGHRVFLQKTVEKGANGRNNRICRGVQDRGAGAPDVAGLTNQNGWRVINWAEPTRAKIASKLKRLPGYQAAPVQAPALVPQGA